MQDVWRMALPLSKQKNTALPCILKYYTKSKLSFNCRRRIIYVSGSVDYIIIFISLKFNMNMKKNIALIHLSDLHYRLNWEEDQDLVLEAFFSDLAKQIEANKSLDFYLAFTGDIVKAGSEIEQYKSFVQKFEKNIKVPKTNRIFIPGNHDISVEFIRENEVLHKGIITQKLGEKDFNDFISSKPDVLMRKFENYLIFEKEFAGLGVSENILSGKGWDLNKDVSVYCLNTAACSSGGFSGIDDKEKLSIDTRSLQKWIQNSKAKFKILLMHHPIEWLTDWSQQQINTYLNKDIALCLTGHTHNQSSYCVVNNTSTLVKVVAPPLLTTKNAELGYSIIIIDGLGVKEIRYRQWTKNKTFVTGVNFSDTDDGKIIIRSNSTNISVNFDIDANNYIHNILSSKLTESLRSFSSQPIIWIEPTLSKESNYSLKAEDYSKDLVSINDIIDNPRSTMIFSPPQFGLTCLSHYLIKKAWEKSNSIWLYLDAREIQWHSIDKAIEHELKLINVQIDSITGFVIDSWSNLDKNSNKLLKKISDKYKEIPLIVMHTIDDSKFMAEAENLSNIESIDRVFDELYLLSLSRSNIRKIVVQYNEINYIGEEDVIVNKIVSDLDVLNLHRTPINCITLLKVFESNFDDSPVNRTEMLRRVLFLLFNMEEIPTYKSKPDLTDCEYVLGRFCEEMIRNNNYSFTRDYFSNEINDFCAERVIDLETDVVFDILFQNNIIILREDKFSFRYSYWIFYFAALRMHQDDVFAMYIFDEKKYASFPEIIEFYTGIDRNRNDALKILISDLKAACSKVNEKVGLPDGLNPFRSINWNPSPESIEKMKKEIKEDVLKSKLPDEVKDQFADRCYDPSRPFNQNINQIFHEFSVPILWQTIKAASKALRNSGYAEPDIKRELLGEILRSWKQISDVMLSLSPVLAIKGFANFEGAGFALLGDFGGDIEERINNIIVEIPANVVRWFKDDLYSNKMGTLLFDQLNNEEDEVRKHELIRLIIMEMPNNWQDQVHNYISTIPKNSFYLFDVYKSLRIQYSYGFVSNKTLLKLSHSIKMCIAKHELGIKSPGIKAINKIPDSMLPSRKIEFPET